jgi:hypothetical protein
MIVDHSNTVEDLIMENTLGPFRVRVQERYSPMRNPSGNVVYTSITLHLRKLTVVGNAEVF